MKLITFAGPPSSGKTSVIIRTIECLKQEFSFGVIKFDCLSSFDNLLYEKYNIPVRIGLLYRISKADCSGAYSQDSTSSLPKARDCATAVPLISGKSPRCAL